MFNQTPYNVAPGQPKNNKSDTKSLHNAYPENVLFPEASNSYAFNCPHSSNINVVSEMPSFILKRRQSHIDTRIVRLLQFPVPRGRKENISEAEMKNKRGGAGYKMAHWPRARLTTLRAARPFLLGSALESRGTELPVEITAVNRENVARERISVGEKIDDRRG